MAVGFIGEGPRENYSPAVTDKLDHIMMYQVHLTTDNKLDHIMMYQVHLTTDNKLEW